MRISAYTIQQGTGAEHCSALTDYLRKHGHDVDEHDISCCDDNERCDRDIDLAVFFTISGNTGKVKDRALADGKPCIVLELGYFKNRYEAYSVSLLYGAQDKIHNNSGYFLDTQKCDDKRLHAMDEKVQPNNSKSKVGTALVLGQVPGDTQLGGMDIEKWSADMISTLKSCGYDVTFRAHPGLVAPVQSLESALLASSIVASYNSTALVEAIRLGVPFVCGHTSQYYSMSVKDELSKPSAKAYKDRHQFLCNLANCQYNKIELKEGLAWWHVKRLLELRGVTQCLR